MSRFSRRRFLRGGLAGSVLGASSLGSFGRMRSLAANAGSGSPSRLLTIHLPGGWAPYYLFCPFSASEVDLLIPEPSHPLGQDPIFFSAADVTNLDGSGNAKDNLGFDKLRVPQTWDTNALAGGQPAPNFANGWSWVAHQLWKYCSVVHGVDMGTNSHSSALISMLSGVPASVFKSPPLASWVASSFGELLPNQRPLGAVTIGEPMLSGNEFLGIEATPSIVGSFEQLVLDWSEESDQAWLGLRDRIEKEVLDYWGNAGDAPLATNALEALVSKRIRGYAGGTNTETDLLFEELYDAFQDVSQTLGADVISVIQQTNGIEHLVPAFWNYPAGGPLGLQVNGTVSENERWTSDFNLALKLLKSDLVSSVTLTLSPLVGRDFDMHLEGHAHHYQQLRGSFDVIGRMLGEMAMTPLTAQTSLLDDTLVMITSELGRTLPLSGSCDHWPYNSVVFAGGGITPNRMCGGYDVEPGAASALGFPGTPLALIDTDGNTQVRAPQSIDIIYTAMSLLGLDDIYIPGQPGRILGITS